MAQLDMIPTMYAWDVVAVVLATDGVHTLTFTNHATVKLPWCCRI